MEKLKRLPPGFRFHPTDEELVVQYLRRKVFSYPLPASIIPEIDLAKFDPWDLPDLGGSGGEKYFFNLRESKNRNRPNYRATRSGYWKTTGKDRPVVIANSIEPVGMKRVLVFHQGKPPNGSRTSWVMHEYRLSNSKNSTNCSLSQGEDWVVCRIFEKKKATRMQEEIAQCYGNRQRVQINCVGYITMMQRNDGTDLPPTNTSGSASSCITGHYDEGCNDGEEASSNLFATST